MIAIDAIISQFSTEEQQEFIKYLNYKNKRHDTKNVQLFKLLLANHPAKEIPQKLYGKDNKTAFTDCESVCGVHCSILWQRKVSPMKFR